MVLSTLKDICAARFRTPGFFLDKIVTFRPKPDGLQFTDRPIMTPEEAGSITPPDKVSSFVKARQINISDLSKTVLNNLSVKAIEPGDREKLSELAKCQYQKFQRITKECNQNEDFHKELEKWGVVFEPSKKELWTQMTLNTNGQVKNYELILNGMTVGFIQFMEKTLNKNVPDYKYISKLEIENAFQIELPEDSAQVTDLSLDPVKLLWALNLSILSADNLTKVQSEIEDGVFIFLAGFFLTIVENPKTMFTSDVSNISCLIHHVWLRKMIDLGIISKDNVIDSGNLQDKYYGLPREYLRVVNFSRDQLKETSVKMNYLKTNKLKAAV